MRFDSGDFKKVVGFFILAAVFCAFMFILLFGNDSVLYSLFGLVLIAVGLVGARFLRG
jgi:hypothetical protein